MVQLFLITKQFSLVTRVFTDVFGTLHGVSLVLFDDTPSSLNAILAFNHRLNFFPNSHDIIMSSSHFLVVSQVLPLSSLEIEEHIFKPKKIAPNLKITKETLFGTSLRFKNILRNKTYHRSQRYT
jgi:hypothetical protein